MDADELTISRERERERANKRALLYVKAKESKHGWSCVFVVVQIGLLKTRLVRESYTHS